MTLADLLPSLRPTLAARLEPGLWPLTTRATSDGALQIGGVDLAGLAARFGTPVQVLDTADVRARCRAYRAALPDAAIVYAGKAFLCRGRVRLVADDEVVDAHSVNLSEGGVLIAGADFPSASQVRIEIELAELGWHALDAEVIRRTGAGEAGEGTLAARFAEAATEGGRDAIREFFRARLGGGDAA